MNADQKLQTLQAGFAGMYLINLFIGLAVTMLVLPDAVGGLSGGIFPGWLLNVSMGFSLMVGLVILVLAWLVYGRLRKGQPWARILLLIIAWVEGVSGLLSLLTLPLMFKLPVLSWLAPRAFSETVLAAGVITNLLKAAFAAWFIWTVQFDPEVRRFFPRPSAPARHESAE